MLLKTSEKNQRIKESEKLSAPFFNETETNIILMQFWEGPKTPKNSKSLFKLYDTPT